MFHLSVVAVSLSVSAVTLLLPRCLLLLSNLFIYRSPRPAPTPSCGFLVAGPTSKAKHKKTESVCLFVVCLPVSE